MDKSKEYNGDELVLYTNDRKPTADDYKTAIKTDKEFLDMGPKFTAYYLTNQSKEANNGGIDVAVVRSQLLAIFCYNKKLAVTDEMLKYYDDLAAQAYTELR